MRERWQFTSSWEASIEELDDIIAGDRGPDQIAAWAMQVSQSFGVGMGSMSDTYISDDFDPLRQEVQESLWSVVEAAQHEPKNPLPLRRHLTQLETALLDGHIAADAAVVRQLLARSNLDMSVSALVDGVVSAEIDGFPVSRSHVS